MAVPLKNDISIWRPGGMLWRIEITITKPDKASIMKALSDIKTKLNEEIPDEA